MRRRRKYKKIERKVVEKAVDDYLKNGGKIDVISEKNSDFIGEGGVPINSKLTKLFERIKNENM